MEAVYITTIVCFAIVLIAKEYFHYKERVDSQKIEKIKDVKDLSYVFPQKEEEEVEEESNLVELENIPLEDFQ